MMHDASARCSTFFKKTRIVDELTHEVLPLLPVALVYFSFLTAYGKGSCVADLHEYSLISRRPSCHSANLPVQSQYTPI
jgi:hypothetical protein